MRNKRNAIGENLQMYRERRGMTRADLADAIGVTSKSIGNWERGDRDPSTSYLSALAKVLEVSKSDLIGETNATVQNTISYVMPDNSMSPEIMQGDRLIINEDKQAQNGDVVLVEVWDTSNHKTEFIRRLYQFGKQIALLAVNTSLPPIHASHDDVKVKGKVTELNRQI